MDGGDCTRVGGFCYLFENLWVMYSIRSFPSSFTLAGPFRM